MRIKLYVGIALIVFTLLTANIIAFGMLPNIFAEKTSKILAIVNKTDEGSYSIIPINSTQESTPKNNTTTQQTTQVTQTTQTQTQQIVQTPTPTPKPKVTRAS